MTIPMSDPAGCTARTARARTAVHRLPLPGMGFRAVHGLLGIFRKSYKKGTRRIQVTPLARFTPHAKLFENVRASVRNGAKPCPARVSRERTGARTSRVCARSGQRWESRARPPAGSAGEARSDAMTTVLPPPPSAAPRANLRDIPARTHGRRAGRQPWQRNPLQTLKGTRK
jgi:hypothetical protein